ncbi:MAG: TonB-dependent receptor plug domain-containing protein, partial [Opitutaceae bacterium]|nr:TonB-dependent receptor plug domain-containing protein [Opitutaceae bacterium]
MKTCTPPCSASAFCRFAFALAFLIFSAVFAGAQTESGALGGRITDTKGDPLSGALVTLKENGREASTTRGGEYFFAGLPAGVYTASVSYLGLPSKEISVTIAAGVESTLMVKLGEDVLVLEAFQVEGQRSGQARALNEQRASGNLRNIVSSDAAGRFPDQNAAESMQRIAGVSLERDQGEGRFISVRGVDPDLNNTQLNGVSIPASQEDSRKVNLDVFPTDILDSIEVVKAVTPDMDGDAIGGSVNIKTQTAFSSDQRILRASVEGGYSDLVDKWGYKYSVTYGDKFKDGKLGFLVSYSASKRQFGSNGREADDNPWVAKGGFIVPGGDLQHREYNIIRWRSGLSFSLDYRPDS